MTKMKHMTIKIKHQKVKGAILAASLIELLAVFAFTETAFAAVQSKKHRNQARTAPMHLTNASAQSEGTATSILPDATIAASNYVFSTATNASLTDMSSGTTQLLGPDINDTAS